MLYILEKNPVWSLNVNNVLLKKTPARCPPLAVEASDSRLVASSDEVVRVVMNGVCVASL